MMGHSDVVLGRRSRFLRQRRESVSRGSRACGAPSKATTADVNERDMVEANDAEMSRGSRSVAVVFKASGNITRCPGGDMRLAACFVAMTFAMAIAASAQPPSKDPAASE